MSLRVILSVVLRILNAIGICAWCSRYVESSLKRSKRQQNTKQGRKVAQNKTPARTNFARARTNFVSMADDHGDCICVHSSFDAIFIYCRTHPPFICSSKSSSLISLC